MGDIVALPGIFPQDEDTERKGGPMSIIEMPIETALEWYNFLRRPDVSLSYADFIGWALREANLVLTDCNDDGTAWCLVHDSPGEPEADESVEWMCDTRQAAFD